ncbi:hypothetical protein N9X61_04580 [Sulfurimonas sp.]|nr:hypothetical protein [Sulfurimonas sp.]
MLSKALIENLSDDPFLSKYENVLLALVKEKVVVKLVDVLHDTNEQLKEYRNRELKVIETNGNSKQSPSENMEYLELKGMVSKQTGLLQMLVPKKATVSFLAESTGKTRQAIRQFLLKNFEPEEDFWTKGGKMYVSQDTAVTVLMRSIK